MDFDSLGAQFGTLSGPETAGAGVFLNFDPRTTIFATMGGGRGGDSKDEACSRSDQGTTNEVFHGISPERLELVKRRTN